MKSNKISIFCTFILFLMAFETMGMEKQKRLNLENAEAAPAAKKAKQGVSPQSGAQLEICKDDGWAPLHIAALEGDVAAI